LPKVIPKVRQPCGTWVPKMTRRILICPLFQLLPLRTRLSLLTVLVAHAMMPLDLRLLPHWPSLKKSWVTWTRSNWSLTVKTDSRNNPVSTLTKFNHTNTTLVPHTRAFTRTRLRLSQKSINQLVPVTSPELTTRKSPSNVETSVVRPPRTSTCSRLTTTFSVSNRVWAVSRSPTKRVLNVY